jgi:hypothetical protein
MRDRMILFLVLAGCASKPEVVDIGQGRCTLTAEAHVPCPGAAREEALSQAADFCTKSHKMPTRLSNLSWRSRFRSLRMPPRRLRSSTEGTESHTNRGHFRGATAMRFAGSF